MLKFELSDQMVAIIGAALGKQPYDMVAEVITELQKQINAQTQTAPLTATNKDNE
jgi:hypothetical protein